MRPWCLLWLGLISAGVQAQDPFCRHYTMADGLPSNTVYRALEDRDGFLWFATDAGVARFDGLEFRTFSTPDGLGDNEIIMLFEDSKGRIWFLSLNGRLSYWYQGRIHNGSTDVDLAKYRGRSGWHTAAEDRQGRIWFGGVYGELARIDLEGGQDTVVRTNIGSKLSLWTDKDGSVWVEAVERMSALDGPHAGRAIPLPAAPRARRVEQQLPWNSPPILFSGGRIMEVEGGVLTPIVPDLTVRPSDPYRNCWREPDGNIWLYRMDLGVDLMHRSPGGGYTAPRHLFPSLRINSVFQDRRGDRWLCTAGNGVLFVGRNAMEGTRVYRAEADRVERLLCMHADGDRVWLGTDRGAIYTFEHNGLERFANLDVSDFRGRVLRIDGRPGQSIWLACDFGLMVLDPGARAPALILSEFVSQGRTVRTLGVSKTVFVARDGKVWSGGNGLLQQEFENGERFRRGYLVDQLRLYRITCITEDAFGTLWLDADGGLISVKDSVRTVHPVLSDHPLARISDLQAWGGDTLAIATLGDGVLLWSKGSVVQRIGTHDGLASTVVRRIRVEGDTLWAATSAGVSALVLHGGRVHAAWSWSARDGLPSADVRDVLVHQGQLLLLTNEGLCVSAVKPERTPVGTPRLHLSSLRTEKRELDAQGPLDLQGGQDRLFLTVHAISFAQPEEVEYMFRSNGTGAWSSCDKGQVSFDRLSAADRSVEVRARFPGGEWSEPLKVSFTVHPPWYERSILRWAALIALMAIVMFVVYAISRRRYRRELAAAKAQAVLDTERRRIAADVHDDLGADLSRLLMHARHDQHAGANTGKKHVTDGLEAAIHKIDEIIWSLDPRRDTLQATILFIEGIARDLAEAHGLKFRTAVSIPGTDFPLSAEQRRELMLIAREALRNVVRHAAATELRVTWERSDGTLRLVIEDDGAGMPEMPNEDRHGLVNMRDRAERLGAEISIRKGAEGGTCVVVIMPLHKNHPNG